MKSTAVALALLAPTLAWLAQPQPAGSVTAASAATVRVGQGVEQGQKPEPLRSATVIFLRHAEAKERTRTNRDPDLAEPGTKRAALLAKTLANAGVTRVFATGLQRTQQTAAPIAKRLGLKVETYNARKTKDFVQTLQALKTGEVALVVGHSNTVPEMVAALGGKLGALNARGFLHETEHDRLLVQVLASQRADQPMKAMQTLDLRIQAN